MDEENMSAEDRLKNIEAERKELRAEVAGNKAERLAQASQRRGIRDTENKRVSAILWNVKKEIFAYNKSGKVLKAKNKILENIAKLVSPQDEPEVETTDSSF